MAYSLTDKLISIGKYYTKKGAMEAVCHKISTLGMTQQDADILLLKLAEIVKMKPMGRASKHLQHFLGGTGKDLHFDSSILVQQDPQVRLTIENHIRGEVVIGNQNKSSIGFGRVPVKQSNFQNQDWRLALGSFHFDWEIVDQKSGNKYDFFKTVFVKISGENKYQWHPKVERYTQCVHEAGKRLTETTAADYWMKAKPSIITVNVFAHGMR